MAVAHLPCGQYVNANLGPMIDCEGRKGIDLELTL